MNLTSDDLLGKEIVDPQGDILGVSVKLHLDLESRTILGLTIDQGMWKPDLFIGVEMIQKFGKDAIFLNRVPYSKLKGMKVYSYDGKYIGRVTEVEWNADGYSKLKVQKKRTGILQVFLQARSESILLDPEDVQEIGYAIILKEGRNR